jgi:hypothetical protein
MKTAEKLENKLQLSRKNFPGYLAGVVKSAKQLSGYREPVKSNEPVFTGRFQKEGYTIEKYFVKGEGDYVIPYLLMKPENSNHKALIYLHPSDKSAEALPGGEMEWFVKNGFTVLAPDLLGVGEMSPENTSIRVYLRIWYASMLIGRSILGVQAGDVVSLTNLLKKSQGIDEVYGLARKEMTPVLLHAAAFDPSITRIALIEPYSSYRSVAMNRLYDPKFINSLVPGALEFYDLPDLAVSLAPRQLMIVGGLDGAGNSGGDSINKDFEVVKNGYRYRHANDALIISEEPAKEHEDIYRAWIK